MSQETVLDWGRQSMMLIIQVAGPIVGAGLVIGVAVGVFQAATQIQEQSLTFVPKMAALMGVLLLTGGWMMTKMVEFTRAAIMSLPNVVR